MPRWLSGLIGVLTLLITLSIAAAGPAVAMEGGDGSGSTEISLIPPTSSAVGPAGHQPGRQSSAPPESVQISLIPPTSSAIAPAEATDRPRSAGESSAPRRALQHSAGRRTAGVPAGLPGVQKSAPPAAQTGPDRSVTAGDATPPGAPWLVPVGVTVLLTVGGGVLVMIRWRRHDSAHSGSGV